MKARTFACITAMTLFAVLAQPGQVAAQQHTLYRLIDIGTFGGPASYLGDPGVGPGVLHLNNRGVLIGHADTAFSDPNAPDNCDNPDCFLSHASRWEDGVLTDLATLPGGDRSQATSINARGWIAGGSKTGEFDPLTGGFSFMVFSGRTVRSSISERSAKVWTKGWRAMQSTSKTGDR